jgi:hypothetical protein
MRPNAPTVRGAGPARKPFVRESMDARIPSRLPGGAGRRGRARRRVAVTDAGGRKTWVARSPATLSRTPASTTQRVAPEQTPGGFHLRSSASVARTSRQFSGGGKAPPSRLHRLTVSRRTPNRCATSPSEIPMVASRSEADVKVRVRDIPDSERPRDVSVPTRRATGSHWCSKNVSRSEAATGRSRMPVIERRGADSRFAEAALVA